MAEFQNIRFGLVWPKPRWWHHKDHLTVIGNERRDNSWFVFDQRQLDQVVRQYRHPLFTHEPVAVTLEVMRGFCPKSTGTIADAVYHGSVQYGTKAKSWKHFVLMTTDGWEHAKGLGQLAVNPADPQQAIGGRRDYSQLVAVIARAERVRQMQEEHQPRIAVG